MYPDFPITHRLQVGNIIVETRDFEWDQDDEFEFSLPHFAFSCIPDITARKPIAYWQLPADEQWIPQRQIGVMPADLPIRVRFPKGHSRTLVCIIKDEPTQLQWSPSAVASTLRVAQPEVYKLSSLLMRELEANRLAQREMVAALGKLLNLHVGRYREEANDSHTLVPWRMRKIEDAVHMAATGAVLNVEELADDCRMSKKYLLSQFRQATGRSLTDYVWSAKAEQAKHLIEQGESFSTIVSKLNYSGPGHFTVRFSRHTGVTPSEYRQQVTIR